MCLCTGGVGLPVDTGRVILKGGKHAIPKDTKTEDPLPAVTYTTKVPVAQTTAEMQALLGKSGASAVAVMYEEGKPVGMTFTLATPGGERAFELPVDVGAVQKLLSTQKRTHRAVDDRPAQAERVAWRIVRMWLAAQLTLIEAQMASLDEVMLPYLVTAPHRTLRDDWRDRAALPAGESL